MCLKQSLEIETPYAPAIMNDNLRIQVLVAKLQAIKNFLDWLNMKEMEEQDANNKEFLKAKILKQMAKISIIKDKIRRIDATHTFDD